MLIRTYGWLFLFLLVFSSSGMAVPASGIVPASSNSNQVGIVAAIRGVVKVETPAKVGREVKSGMPIYLGDTVTTDDKGNLQIMLMDQTTFTIGPNSAIIIDKFVYDPATHEGQVNAKIVKGVFRFVTGKIGKKNPESINVDLPSGTIGIRGTIVAGRAEGQRSFVVLLGPGERNNTGSRKGSIVVGAVVNGKLQAVKIDRSGFGTVIERAGEPPSKPFQVPAELMQQITNALGSTSAAEDSEGNSDQSQASDQSGEDSQSDESSDAGETFGEDASATEEAGQDTAEAFDSVMSAETFESLFGEADDESEKSSQENVEEQNGIFDGLSTFNDLSKIEGGQFKYEQNGVTLYDSAGTSVGNYSILLNIDFGARTVGGPDSSINGSVNSHNFAFALFSQSFGNGEDFAAYVFDGNNSNANNANVVLDSAEVYFFNEGGDPGSSILHAVSLTDNTNSGYPVTAYGAGIASREAASSTSGDQES